MNTQHNTPCGRNCLTCGLCKHHSSGPAEETPLATAGTNRPKSIRSQRGGAQSNVKL